MSEFIKVVVRIDKKRAQRSKTFLRVDSLNNKLVLSNPKEAYSSEKLICDAIYEQNCSQAVIYEQQILSLVKDVVKGYNGTVFTYGQINSGKTFTMFGDHESDLLKGVLPRTFPDVFNIIESTKDREFTVSCSFVGIVNQFTYDLFMSNTKWRPKEQGIKGISKQEESPVANQSLREVRSTRELKDLFLKGLSNLLENSREHRCHTVFTVQVESGKLEGTSRKRRVGKLCLVDLAGFLDYANTHTSRVADTSLEKLEKVIQTLADPTLGKVSYRESKLGTILRGSFGGNSRTVMIATIVPTSYYQSCRTFSFANQAKMIENRPTVCRRQPNLNSETEVVLRKQGLKLVSKQQKDLELKQLVKDKEDTASHFFLPSLSKNNISKPKPPLGTSENPELDQQHPKAPTVAMTPIQKKQRAKDRSEEKKPHPSASKRSPDQMISRWRRQISSDKQKKRITRPLTPINKSKEAKKDVEKEVEKEVTQVEKADDNKNRPLRFRQVPNSVALLPKPRLIQAPKAEDYVISSCSNDMLSLLQSHLTNHTLFIDAQAPPSHKGEYLHAKDIFKLGYTLFQKSTDINKELSQKASRLLKANHINQGSLGNCYFMSSIASLVEYYPEFLSKLFIFDVNPSGMYVVKLFNDGEWTNIVLDDRFPCEGGKPIFSKPHDNEIWVLLLEKAWAKLHGSYQSIESGNALEALVALTGAPCSKFSDKEGLFRFVQQGFKSKRIVACGDTEALKKLTEPEAKQLGLIQNHGYSVLRLVEVSSGGGKQSLVKVRNPWGKFQWQGDWSFSSSKWTTALRDKLNYKQDPQDGSFYMAWDDFERYLGDVTICKLTPNAVTSSFRSLNRKLKSNYIDMKVIKQGLYVLSIYQPSKRKHKYAANYELSESRLIISKVEEAGNLQYVQSGNTSSGNLQISVQLPEGDYIVSCMVAWNSFEEYECIVSSYGPSNVHFSAAKDLLISKRFKKDMIRSYAEQFHGQRTHFKLEEIAAAHYEVNMNMKHGIGYIQINNPTDQQFGITFDFPTLQGLYPIDSLVLPLSLNMQPQTDRLVGFYASAKGTNYEYRMSYRLAN